MTNNPAMTAGPTGLESFGQRALAVGLAGGAACAAGAFMNPPQFFRAYLVAWLFWLGISVGSLAIAMLHHLTGGGWGIVIRRPLESAARVLPLMAALFVPLLFGLKHLYPWARPDLVAKDPLLQHKAPYLNAPFFTARAAIYFAVWIGLAWILTRWSQAQDATRDDQPLLQRMQRLSAGGVIAVVLTVTLASVDWVMSLEPHWYSTIYGGLLLVGQALAAFAFVILVTLRLWRGGPLAGTITTTHVHDLGKLLFTFVLVWAYFAFSQFLIVYSGNLPEEIPWYLKRLQGGWQITALAVVLFHFALPFFMLLSKSIKENTRLLSGVALMLLGIRLVDLFWVAAPAVGESPRGAGWMDAVAPIAVGGPWLFAFVRRLGRLPLLPAGDPHLQEALDHGHE